MRKHVFLKVPATSANLGPGFDVLGLALAYYSDVSFSAEFDAKRAKKSSAVRIEMLIEGEGAHTLPHDSSNLVVQAAQRVFERVRQWPSALHLHMINRLPLSRGMGSSAAATVAGVVGANIICGRPLSDADVLDLAVSIEGHPDNIVPALVGGLCVSGMQGERVHYFKYALPSDLRAVVCIPEKPLPTKEARRVLPKQVSLADAVFTSSRVAFLVSAIVQRRYDLLGFAMEDVLHQPARATLIRGLLQTIQAAKRAGAYGAALSGAGSCVIAIVPSGATSARVGKAMHRTFAAHGMKSEFKELAFENKGLRIEN